MELSLVKETWLTVELNSRKGMLKEYAKTLDTANKEVAMPQKGNDLSSIYLNEIVSYLIDFRGKQYARIAATGFFATKGHLALTDLIQCLQGDFVNILKHKDLLCNGDIGHRIQLKIINNGYATKALGVEISTVEDFITQTQNKVHQNNNNIIQNN